MMIAFVVGGSVEVHTALAKPVDFIVRNTGSPSTQRKRKGATASHRLSRRRLAVDVTRPKVCFTATSGEL
jgi:hypothetical protein